MSKIYILCGYTLSGKTTWSGKQNLKVFNYDSMKYDPNRNGLKMEVFMEQEVRKYGGDCVLDHTSWSEKSIKRLCETYKDYDITIVIFDITYDRLLKNRQQTDRKIKGLETKTTKERFGWFKEEAEKVKKLPYKQIVITDKDYVDSSPMTDFLV